MSRSIAIALLALAAASGAARAEDAQTFFKDRQLRFIIATAAGGDYDLWGRAITRHMGNHLWNATFVVQNMPGAGGINAANHLFNVAPKDGSTIGMIGRNLPNQAVLKLPTVKFDPARFNWIGSPEYVNRVCVAMDTAPVKTGNDLLSTELVVGGAGAGTAVSTVPLLLRNLLGLKFNVVEGYGSSTAVVLAMERGEVQGICQTINALRNSRPGWIESGRMNVLFNVERDPIPGLGKPSVYEYVKTPEQRQILDFYSSSVELGRPIVAPPDVPLDRVVALRRAFDETMKDPAFLEDARKLGAEINPRSGERLTGIIKDLMQTPLDITEKTEAMTQRPSGPTTP